jgi:hypothetical protein
MVRYRYGNKPKPPLAKVVNKPKPVEVKPIEIDKPIETRIENGKKIEVYKFRL